MVWLLGSAFLVDVLFPDRSREASSSAAMASHVGNKANLPERYNVPWKTKNKTFAVGRHEAKDLAKHLREEDRAKVASMKRLVTFVGKFADWKRLDAVLYAAKEYEARKHRDAKLTSFLSPFSFSLVFSLVCLWKNKTLKVKIQCVRHGLAESGDIPRSWHRHCGHRTTRSNSNVWRPCKILGTSTHCLPGPKKCLGKNMVQRNHQNVCIARLKLNDSRELRSRCACWAILNVRGWHATCSNWVWFFGQSSLAHTTTVQNSHMVFGVWPQSLPGVIFSHATHFSIEISICFIVFLHIFCWNVNSGSHLTKSLSAWSSSNAWHVALLQLVQTVGDPLSLSSQNRVSLLRRKPIGVPNLEWRGRVFVFVDKVFFS